MRCTQCNAEVTDDAKFCQNCGTAIKRSADIDVKQDVKTVKGDVTGLAAGKGADAGGLRADIDQTVGTVEDGGTVAGAVFGGDEGNVHVGGRQQYGDTVQGDKNQIHTGGGAFIGGSVSAGGDFVGRDKVVRGDEVHGDKIMGDKVSGDKIGGDRIDVGNITGSSGVAIGRNVQASVTQVGSSPDAARIAQLFAPVYAHIDQLSIPAVLQGILKQQVETIEQAAQSGKQTNQQTIDGAISALKSITPDISGLVIDALNQV